MLLWSLHDQALREKGVAKVSDCSLSLFPSAVPRAHAGRRASLRHSHHEGATQPPHHPPRRGLAQRLTLAASVHATNPLARNQKNTTISGSGLPGCCGPLALPLSAGSEAIPQELMRVPKPESAQGCVQLSRKVKINMLNQNFRNRFSTRPLRKGASFRLG